MEIDVAGGIISPGDLVLVSYSHGFEIGFYAGKGRGTLQYLTVRGLNYAMEKKMRKYPWTVSYIGGYNPERRMTRYSPELITDVEQRAEVENAIDFIRQTNILPVKY